MGPILKTPIGSFRTFTANHVGIIFVPRGNDDIDDIWLDWEEVKLLIQQLESFLKNKTSNSS